MRQLVEIMQRLEDTQERLARERRREPRRTTRYHMHYETEEEEEWRVQNVETPTTKDLFSFCKVT